MRYPATMKLYAALAVLGLALVGCSSGASDTDRAWLKCVQYAHGSAISKAETPPDDETSTRWLKRAMEVCSEQRDEMGEADFTAAWLAAPDS